MVQGKPSVCFFKVSRLPHAAKLFEQLLTIFVCLRIVFSTNNRPRLNVYHPTGSVCSVLYWYAFIAVKLLQ